MYLSKLIIRTNKLCISGLTLKQRWRTYTKLSYIHNVGTEPLKYITIGNLLEENAKKYANAEIVYSVYQNQRFTYKKLLEDADTLAAGFLKIGLEKGDRIGIWAPNIAEWVTVMAASARAGLILVSINPSYVAKDMTYCINMVGVKAIVCPDKHKKLDFYNILNEISSELPESEPGKLNSANVPSLKTVISISNYTLRGTYNYNDILNFSDQTSIKKIRDNQKTIKPDDVFNIQFTSGTTGNPKAACLTHFNFVNNAFFTGKRNECSQKQHKICVQVPFFHAFGSAVVIGNAFHFGTTLVLPSPTYDPTAHLKAIENEECTIITGTPTMYVDLVNAQKQMKVNIHPEIAVTGGAPCSPKLFNEMQNILNVKKVKSIYGLTEATAMVFQSLPVIEDEYKSTATVGKLGEHIEAKIVDHNDNIVPIGTPGELLIRGYSIMRGYWDNKEKTMEMIGIDGWLKTGDQFVLEENGYGRVVGRLKEMIIRGGENIFPKEIEDFINTHPDVLESYVIGLKHERLGEEVCACVRVRKGSEITLESLIAFCKGELAHFKIPSQLIIMDSFPKTLSGKIQKFLLKEEAEKLLCR